MTEYVCPRCHGEFSGENAGCPWCGLTFIDPDKPTDRDIEDITHPVTLTSVSRMRREDEQYEPQGLVQKFLEMFT